MRRAFAGCIIGLALVLAAGGVLAVGRTPGPAAGRVAAQGSWEVTPAPWMDCCGRSYGISDITSAGSEAWAVADDSILRYSDGQWSIEFVMPRDYITQWMPSLYTIDMVSPTEGWAAGDAGTLWHYSGGQWQEAASPTQESISTLRMVSADEGWAVGSYGTILHYSAGAWQVYTSPTSAVHLTDLSIVDANNAWAVGYWSFDEGVILRYNGSEWITETVPVARDVVGISMLSTTDGWVTGAVDTMLRYDGVSWHQVEAPDSPGGPVGVAAVAADDVWATGIDLYHYDGTGWTTIPNPVPPCTAGKGLGTVYFPSPDEGWAVGSCGAILHYTADGGGPQNVEVRVKGLHRYLPLLGFDRR